MLSKDQLRGRHVLIKGALELLREDVRASTVERFRARLHVSTSLAFEGSACITFNGGTNGDGYGLVKIATTPRQRVVLAHRLAYALEYGSCPPHLVIDHRCRERRCCNVRHFKLTTPEVNTPAIYGVAPRDAHVSPPRRPVIDLDGVTYADVDEWMREVDRRAEIRHGPKCRHGWRFCAPCGSERPVGQPERPNTWSDEWGPSAAPVSAAAAGEEEPAAAIT